MINSTKMRHAKHVVRMDEMKNLCHKSVGKLEENRPGRMYYGENTECDWIQIVRKIPYCCALVHMIMSFHVP